MTLPEDGGSRVEAPSRWIPAGSVAFPNRLRGLQPPFPGLWVRTRLEDGDLAGRIWNLPAVAVVGARAASAAGLEIARQLGWDLARAGVAVVSGLARGIDAAGHEGALLAGGWTVAVLGCGIDGCYPPEHGPLAARIAAHGVVVSEWPGRLAPKAGLFPRRNRLISGLSDIVVVVEGGARSGARHTVRFALDDGREVMAVPRDPILPGSRTPNRLLRDGAPPVLDAGDVLALLRARPAPGEAVRGDDAGAGPGARPADRRNECAQDPARRRRDDPVPGAARAPARPSRGRRTAVPARADEDAADGLGARLLAALRRSGDATFDELAERLPGESCERLQAALLSLEVERRIARAPAGRYRPAAEEWAAR